MKSTTKQRKALRGRRHGRIKRKIRGTAARPRLVVFRSLKHIEGQVVDDDRGRTLIGFSTRSMEGGPGEEAGERTGKVAVAFAAGKRLAALAAEEGVTDVVFDRAGYPYHGRVRAFAEGAREGGLRF